MTYRGLAPAQDQDDLKQKFGEEIDISYKCLEKWSMVI